MYNTYYKVMSLGGIFWGILPFTSKPEMFEAEYHRRNSMFYDNDFHNIEKIYINGE